MRCNKLLEKNYDDYISYTEWIESCKRMSGVAKRVRELKDIYHHHPERKKRKSSEGNSDSIHPGGRDGNDGKTSKTMSTIAILWPIKAIFEKRATTVEVDALISPEGGFSKGWFWRMFTRNENRNEGTFRCATGTRTGTRVRSHVPPKREPEPGYVRQNHHFTKLPFCLLSTMGLYYSN